MDVCLGCFDVLNALDALVVKVRLDVPRRGEERRRWRRRRRTLYPATGLVKGRRGRELHREAGQMNQSAIETASKRTRLRYRRHSPESYASAQR